MALLDLPVEILDQIIGLTLPSGIEAFALCCKAVHTRAASEILRHNSLKQQWRCTAITNHHRGDILRILYEISCNPLIGQYIESLILWDREQGPDGGDSHFQLSAEVMGPLKKTVLDFECLNDAGVDADDWWEEILREHKRGIADSRGDEEALYTTISLLAQLPNLKTLELPPGWYDRSRQYERNKERTEKRLLAVLDAMIEQSNSNACHGKALGKLEFILPSMEEGYDEERAPLQCLEPFMKLKSLKELYATSCLAVDDGYTGIPFQWRFPETNSSLTRVELTFCCMDADGISVLLSHTPLLSVFKYSHETKWHGCLHDWNAGAFVEALAKHCGHSITELAITLDWMGGDVCNGASFRSFPNLRNLEIDLRVLCGPPLGSGQEQGMLATIKSEWTVEELPCLADLLPESIVETQINTHLEEQHDEDEKALKMLLKDFPNQRESRLKDLAKIVVRQYRGDSLRTLVKKAGAKLSVFDQDGRHNWATPTMPAWKRNFDWRVEALEVL